MVSTETKSRTVKAKRSEAPRARLKVRRIQPHVSPGAAVFELPTIELTDRERTSQVTAESVQRPTDTWD